MKELLGELMWKCYDYNLQFEYNPDSAGVIITDTYFNKIVTSAWLDGDNPRKEVRKLIINTGNYLKNEPYEELHTIKE